jgi:hypothetical protein
VIKGKVKRVFKEILKKVAVHHLTLFEDASQSWKFLLDIGHSFATRTALRGYGMCERISCFIHRGS